MDSVETQWFYLYEGASRIGPVVFSTLQERAKRGLLHPTDYVWREGLRDWTQACKATDLFPDYSSSPVIVESSAPQSLPPVPSERGASAEMYAGFLRRAVAYAVDWCLLGPLVAANRAVFRSLESANTEEALGSLLFLWLAPWLYYSLMECSSLQGTVGKLLLGIMVVAGRAKPARSGRVKTGHLEELVIRDKAIFGPWWTEEARHGESSQDGRRTVDTSTSGAGLVVSTDWPGTGDPSGHGQAILCSGGVR